MLDLEKIISISGNVAAIMINRILQNKKPIIYGDGEQTRSFSDIEDCIYCIDKLITDEKIKSEIFNIGPDENSVTVNQLFEIISNLTKFNQGPEYYPERPQEVKHSNCSADKARKLLNYETKNTVEQSLRNMVDFIKERGPKEFKYNYNLEIISKLTPETWKKKIL